jgi:SnoaL-like domain
VLAPERIQTAEPNPIAVVERYLALLEDPTSEIEAIAGLLDPEVRFVEHPNLVNPRGTERDRGDLLASVEAGRRLLREQRFEVVDHLVVGDRVATRVVWTGTLASGSGPPGGFVHALHAPAGSHRPAGELRLLPRGGGSAFHRRSLISRS